MITDCSQEDAIAVDHNDDDDVERVEIWEKVKEV